MKDKLLKVLQEKGQLSDRELALRLETSEEEVHKLLEELRRDGILLGYQAVINWEATEKESTTALIEVRVTPQRGLGFDRIARRLYQYPEVDSCYLMSGGFDLMIIIEGKTLRDVARFVSDKIAPMESVLSTSTHFILKKYKSNGTIFAAAPKDEREAVVL